MRKIFYIVMFVTMFILIGCSHVDSDVIEDTDVIEETDVIEDSVPNTTPNEYTIVKDGVLTYTSWSHDGNNIFPEKYAEIQLSKLEYHPFTKNLCFTMDISDKDYITTTYWIIKRPRGTSRTESQISFKMNSSKKSFHHCESYNPDSEIVFGLVNSKDLNPTTSLDVLAWITVDDEKENSRVYPEGGHFITRNFTYDEIYIEKLEPDNPYILMDYQFTDSARLYKGMYMELYYRPFDMVYQSKEIVFTEDMYVNDTIDLDTLLFEDLPPDVEFEIHYYFKGTDGVNTYDYVYFGSRTVTSTSTGMTSRIDNSYPGLWANIINYEIGETTTRVYYELVNDGRVLFNNTPVTTEIGVYGKDLRITLDPSADFIEIDNVYLENYDAFQIYIKETNQTLCTKQLNYNIFGLFEYFGYSNGIFKFKLSDYSVNIISIYFEVRVIENGTPILVYTLTEFPDVYDSSNFQSIDVDKIPSSFMGNTYLHYVVTYHGLLGIETYESNPSSYTRP